MTTKTKGRNGGDRAALKTTCVRNHTSIRSRLKGLIVRLALWGILPVGLAQWLVQHGGMRDA